MIQTAFYAAVSSPWDESEGGRLDGTSPQKLVVRREATKPAIQLPEGREAHGVAPNLQPKVCDGTQPTLLVLTQSSITHTIHHGQTGMNLSVTV